MLPTPGGVLAAPPAGARMRRRLMEARGVRLGDTGVASWSAAAVVAGFARSLVFGVVSTSFGCS